MRCTFFQKEVLYLEHVTCLRGWHSPRQHEARRQTRYPITGGGARNNGKLQLFIARFWSHNGLFMSRLVNYIVPQIHFKKRNLLLAITQQRMRYVADISVTLFLKRFCGTTYVTHVDINNLIMRPETRNELL